VLGNAIVDFCAPAASLVVEVDGDDYHSLRSSADAARDRKLVRAGYTVIRIVSAAAGWLPAASLKRHCRELACSFGVGFSRSGTRGTSAGLQFSISQISAGVKIDARISSCPAALQSISDFWTRTFARLFSASFGHYAADSSRLSWAETGGSSDTVEVDLVGRQAVERPAGHHLVVLSHVEGDEPSDSRKLSSV
jgi:hypothetical protein